MNELFNALLDISKLDAGAMTASISEFPVSRVLSRIAATFTQAARDKGLQPAHGPQQRLGAQRPHPAGADPAQSRLQRRALHVGRRHRRRLPARRGHAAHRCLRHAASALRPDQQRSIFSEFYQVATPERSSKVGLGLGLAIVERLCAVLDHPIGLVSTPGKGSRFSVTVPRVAARAGSTAAVAAISAAAAPDQLAGRLIVVIDDDALALEGTGGLLRSWGCRVVTAHSDREALAKLNGSAPDLIISDFHLQDGRTGIDAIGALRDAFGGAIPAFLVSGDITQQRLRETGASTHHLLHKPVNPMALRAIISSLLKG